MSLRLNPFSGTALTILLCFSSLAVAQGTKKSTQEKGSQVEKTNRPIHEETIQLLTPINLNEKDHGRELKLKVGDRFSITLPTNPSTGYQLFMLTSGDEPWKFLSKRFMSEGKSLPGKGGQEQFFFQVTKAGTSRVSFISARIFDLEGTLKETKPFQVLITVK
jgi:predicted secreted protein